MVDTSFSKDYVSTKSGQLHSADYALLEMKEEARMQAKEALRINPKITAADNTYVRSIEPAQREHIITALRRADLK